MDDVTGRSAEKRVVEVLDLKTGKQSKRWVLSGKTLSKR